MAEAVIPVDLFNPGQVFACLGFLEAAEVLLGDAEGGFDWRDDAAILFRLRAGGDSDPIAAVLGFLAEAQVLSVVPSGSSLSTEKWGVQTEVQDKVGSFPFPEPPSPATLPAILRGRAEPSIRIDYWGDATIRDNVKFWAGSGGYPGAALARDALQLVRDRLPEVAEDPFSLSCAQSSSFRFDWRRDYIPMDVGFSPNEHADVTMVGFPLVEILAAIGLSHARPRRLDKLNYRYAVVQGPAPDFVLDPMLLRAALGCSALPLPRRLFRMLLGWPGQENKARCIVDVTEEPMS